MASFRRAIVCLLVVRLTSALKCNQARRGHRVISIIEVLGDGIVLNHLHRLTSVILLLDLLQPAQQGRA